MHLSHSTDIFLHRIDRHGAALKASLPILAQFTATRLACDARLISDAVVQAVQGKQALDHAEAARLQQMQFAGLRGQRPQSGT